MSWRRPGIFALVVVAVAMTACSVEVDQGIDVAEDDTFDYTVDLRISSDAPVDFGELGDAQPNPDEIRQDLADAADELGARDYAVDQSVDGDGLTMSVSLLGVPFEQAGRVTEGDQLADEANGDQPLLSDLTIGSDGGDYRVDATLAPASALQGSVDTSAGEDGLGDAPFDMGQMADLDVDSTLTVTLPGDVADHNADEHDEETGELTWHADPDAEREIFAASAASGGVVPWVAAGVLAAAVGVVALTFLRRRRAATPVANPFGHPTPAGDEPVTAGASDPDAEAGR